MAVYDINWSAVTASGSGVGLGIVCCPNTTNTGYVPATTANIAAVGRVAGIAITNPDPNGSFAMQYAGEVPASTTGLGVGVAAAVRISATGTLERVVTTPPLTSDIIVGDCDALGMLTLSKVSTVNATSTAPSGTAGGQLSGTYPNPTVNHGTTSVTACAGDDARLSDSRTPSGAAGGQLGGTYPNPTVNHGTSSSTSCAGDDARLSDSRAPSGSASGSLAGSYPSPTVKQVDGAAGVLTSVATEVLCTGLTKFLPDTKTAQYQTTGTALETALTVTGFSAGAHKVNVAISASDAGGADVASWDIGGLLRMTGGVLTIQGTVPSAGGVAPAAPDGNASASPAADWLATFDLSGTSLRVRVKTPGGSGVWFGIALQILSVVP